MEDFKMKIVSLPGEPAKPSGIKDNLRRNESVLNRRAAKKKKKQAAEMISQRRSCKCQWRFYLLLFTCAGFVKI